MVKKILLNPIPVNASDGEFAKTLGIFEAAVSLVREFASTNGGSLRTSQTSMTGNNSSPMTRLGTPQTHGMTLNALRPKVMADGYSGKTR